MSILAEILGAQSERVREFGPEHRITHWPLTAKEWEQFLDEIYANPMLKEEIPPTFDGFEVRLVGTSGEIRVFRGPDY